MAHESVAWLIFKCHQVLHSDADQHRAYRIIVHWVPHSDTNSQHYTA